MTARIIFKMPLKVRDPVWGIPKYLSLEESDSFWKPENSSTKANMKVITWTVSVRGMIIIRTPMRTFNMPESSSV